MHYILMAFFSIFFCVQQSSYAATHRPQVFLEQIQGAQDEGEQIVQHFCANCHAQKPLIELGAPKIGIYEDWKPRLSQGLSQLIKNTEEGMNAMPAMGGCFECSDEQIKLAILALLPETAKKELKIGKTSQKDHK